jgi:hypothetical protein
LVLAKTIDGINVPGLDATITYYGGTSIFDVDFRALKAPILGHFAERNTDPHGESRQDVRRSPSAGLAECSGFGINTLNRSGLNVSERQLNGRRLIRASVHACQKSCAGNVSSVPIVLGMHMKCGEASMQDISRTIRNLLLVGLISFGVPIAGCYTVEEDDDPDVHLDADVEEEDDDIDIDVDD